MVIVKSYGEASKLLGAQRLQNDDKMRWSHFMQRSEMTFKLRQLGTEEGGRRGAEEME